jgi:hypothetical protein
VTRNGQWARLSFLKTYGLFLFILIHSNILNPKVEKCYFVEVGGHCQGIDLMLGE